MKAKGEKFEWREVHPHPCTDKELHTHLVAFVNELIEPQQRPRWRLNLIEKPERAVDEIVGWIPLDPRYCREFTGTQGWPQHVEKLTGPDLGVFYQPGESPIKLRASEAVVLAAERCADAILSIIPGRKALYFNHESQVWLCSK